MNKVILIGNLGDNPDLKYTSAGTAVVNFSLATSERWKDSDGNQQERTTWHRCYMFGSRAETIAKYVTRGSKLAVEGSIRNESYDDKEGNTRYTSKVEVKDFHFLTSLQNGEEGTTKAAPKAAEAASERGSNKPANKAGARVSRKPQPVDAGEPDDDLPF